MTTLAMVHSRVRVEEKMLLAAAADRGVRLAAIPEDQLPLDLEKRPLAADLVLERSLSVTRSVAVLRFLHHHEIPTINRLDVVAACADKAETSLRLKRAGVATPATRVALTMDAALQALQELGYPAVIKPNTGSWARLMARVDDEDQARTILEHKQAFPNPAQHLYYLQQYVDKQGADGRHGDARAFVVGDQTIAAIWRHSAHWITNTARGAQATVCAVDDELNDICQKAAAAVGGGILAIDLMRHHDAWTVHEVNHSMEFRNSIEPTGIDIPGRIVEYAVQEARR